MNNSRGRIIAIVAAVVGLLFQIRFMSENRTGWGVDFNQFYSAGQLVGTGHLYDWPALQKIEAQHLDPGDRPTPTGRLPVVLLVHRVLSLFPYRTAQILWAAASGLALISFALMWPHAERLLLVDAMAWSLPAGLIILFGQDTAFWLMFFAAGLFLLELRRPASAGIAFSLCICKFHLALGIPILLIAQKRWKALIAGTVSLAVLLGCCFALEGPGWPAAYLRMSHLTEFSPSPDVMPTLAALAARLPAPGIAEAIASACVAALLFIFCRSIFRRSEAGLGFAGAAAAACGLLIGHHALFADTALLIPLAVFVIMRERSRTWLTIWALILLSPVPFLLAGALRQPLIWQAMVAPFVCVAIITGMRETQAHNQL